MFRIIPLLLLSALTLPLLAQTDKDDLSWRKHRKMAEQLVEQGQFAEAADHFEAGFRKNPDKKELIYQAGDNYYKVRNFRKAADAFKFVKDEKGKDFDLAGLKYARSLKQDCQYDAASREFAYFLSNYKGDYKNELTDVIQNDIKGCELAMRLSEQPQNSKVKFKLMDDNINTTEQESAPVPFGDDILYFASTMNGKTSMFYRSQLINGRWSKAAPATGFPKVEGIHVGNGCFSPDNQRFYFTQNVPPDPKKKKSDKNASTQNRSEIYVIKKTDAGWSQPQRLRDYINLKDFTTTNPNVVQQGDKEILFFVSDRQGGKGGLDIWYSTRDLKSDDYDFTFPKNAGSVNTKGDEITPFYDTENGTLYFSSNGHISLGGMDIFKSKGTIGQWQPVENLGLPYNSCTDDLYFVMNKNQTGGYLASNRLYGSERISTSNDDIFEFSTVVPAPNLNARGSIFQKEPIQLLKDVTVSLYEVSASGEKKLLSSKLFSDGVYEFAVLPGKQLVLEAEKDGYQGTMLNFNTTAAPGVTTFGESLYLQKTPESTPPPVTDAKPAAPPAAEPADKGKAKPATADTGKKPGKADTSKVPATAKPADTRKTTPEPPADLKPAQPAVADKKTAPAATDKAKPADKVTPPSGKQPAAADKKTTAEAPANVPPAGAAPEPGKTAQPMPTASTAPSAAAKAGDFYRVQIGAYKNFNTGNRKFAKLDGLGALVTEEIPDKGVTRVMVGETASKQEAATLLSSLRKRGFRDAFVVHYRDGVRQPK